MESERLISSGMPVFEFNLIDRLSEELSAELHDNIASKLSIIRLKLSHHPNEVTDAIQLLDTVIGSVRTMSHGLYSPSIAHLNFMEAVRDFLMPLHNVIHIEIHSTHDDICRLDIRIKKFLFRIFQEVIHNILKHSNASVISISVRSSKSFFNFLIRDDGDGFIGNAAAHGGIGLKNIEYRAMELGAKYKFKTRPHQGSLFIISVPIL